MEEVSGQERGGATSVEMALLWGVVTLLILAVVQVALLFYGGQLALTAAEDGLRAVSSYTDGSTDAARLGAEAFLHRAGGATLAGATVTTTIDQQSGIVRVKVEGSAVSLVPGVPLHIVREAVGGLERVTR